jgi:hypothetical protein
MLNTQTKAKTPPKKTQIKKQNSLQLFFMANFHRVNGPSGINGATFDNPDVQSLSNCFSDHDGRVSTCS